MHGLRHPHGSLLLAGELGPLCGGADRKKWATSTRTQVHKAVGDGGMSVDKTYRSLEAGTQKAPQSLAGLRLEMVGPQGVEP